MKEKIYRAGLIPFYVHDNGKVEMKFMVPSDQKYGGSDPQFAKGRIEKNENHEEAAIREAKEELGLREKNVEWIYYLGQFLGRTHIHICEVNSQDEFDVPHYETESTWWMTLDEFETGGRDLHRPVIREAHMVFEQIKQEEEAGGEEFEEFEIN